MKDNKIKLKLEDLKVKSMWTMLSPNREQQIRLGAAGTDATDTNTNYVGCVHDTLDDCPVYSNYCLSNRCISESCDSYPPNCQYVSQGGCCNY